MATKIKLTPKQSALLAAIGDNKFSFFDEGIVEHSGIWMNVLTDEAGNMEEIAKNPKGVATVASSLVKKGFLTSTTDENPDGAWLALTAMGADYINEMVNLKQAQAEAISEEDTHVQEELDLIGSEEEVAEAVEESHHIQEELEELVDREGMAVPDLEGENYRIAEYVDNEGAEWTDFYFADGSTAVKRRRQVSGSWRTDYWGTEAGEDKQRFCLSRDVKAAQAAGKFVHPLV